MNTDWAGHEPQTSEILLDVLTNVTTGSAKPSQTDRVLFTACEFWAAARNRNLMEVLDEDPDDRLRMAEAAFMVIGLDQAARVVRRGRRALKIDPSVSLPHLAADLEKDLAAIQEPVDHKIGAFAAALFAQRRRPTL